MRAEEGLFFGGMGVCFHLQMVFLPTIDARPGF